MRIVSIIPGFGGTFYCGNCLRDSAFVRSLREAGHDAITLPLYMPLSSNGFSQHSETPVFYGAISLYVAQNFRLFRRMPIWMRKMLNSPLMMRLAAKMSGSTRASGLEEMTLSMLRGKEGFQAYELDELINFLKTTEKPDVIHLSNALLLGLAKGIKEELDIPVVCTLQDEDVWVDAMDEPYRTQVWDLMSKKANDVDAFITVSHFFAKKIQQKMRIHDSKIHVVHLGVDPKAYKIHKPNLSVPTIGFLSRSNAGNGFDILIDAFIKLKGNPKFANARLKVTGGKTGDDLKFIRKQMMKLEAKGYKNDIEFIEDFSTQSLSKFFDGTTVLSVPVINGEAFGLYQLEALASGIPIVQPAVGAFPEVANLTGGGVVFGPNTAEALAEKLEEVLSDNILVMQLSESGRKAIEESFNLRVVVEKMVKIYSETDCDNNVLIQESI